MTLKKTIIFIVAIGAAILVPLGLISGAVVATSNYSEYQITSTPQAKIEVDEVTANTAHLHFSIDRSNMVIDSSSSANTKDESRDTKYRYCSDFNILLIKMTAYNEAVKKITGNQVVSVQTYIDRTLEVKDDAFNHDGITDEALESLSIVDTYLLTGDTFFQGSKTYYTRTGSNYYEANIKDGAEVEKGVYYEKVKNTSFEFYVGNLNPEYKYAVAVQFYYSANDNGNTLYNKGLQERFEFETKSK